MISLSDAEKRQLELMRKTQKDKEVYIKASVLLGLSKGYSAELLSDLLGVDVSTIYRHQEKYNNTQNITVYIKNDYKGYSGKLTEEEEASLDKELTEYLYINSKEVANYIETMYGKRYTISGVTKLLKRLGYVYKQTKLIPDKADKIAQTVFLEQISEVLEGVPGVKVYYNDAVHPQHNTQGERGWIKRGTEYEMPSNSGRNRVNILGAQNAHKPSEVSINMEETINSESVVKLWKSIEEENKNERQIIQICDNARYYHSKFVRDWLEKHPKTKVIFLPPYSPNLNLIERLWRFMRKEVINSFFYDAFSKFKKAILSFFSNLSLHKDELNSLCTLKFRV